jgi:hypothetical protein
MNSEMTNTPSFPSAEMHQDDHSSEEVKTPSTQEKLAMYCEKSSPSPWLLSHTTLARLPSLPLSVYHSPSQSEDRHSQSQPRSINLSPYISPSQPDIEIAVTTPPPPHPITIPSRRLNISRDRTPTQSFHAPSFVSSISRYSQLTSNTEKAEDQVLKDSSDNNNGAKGEFPSIADTSTIGSNSETAEDRKLEDSFYEENIHALGKPPFLASLPAFPPLMDTPDDIFTFDYETSGDMSKDSSLSVEDSTEQSITLVEGGTADVGIPSADKNVEEKQMGGHELP